MTGVPKDPSRSDEGMKYVGRMRVKHITFFLWTTNLEAVSTLLLLLVCIYPLTPRPHQLTYSTPSFSTPAFLAPQIDKWSQQIGR